MTGSVIIFMVVCQECPSELMTALKFLHMCQIPESKLKNTSNVCYLFTITQSVVICNTVYVLMNCQINMYAHFL